MTVIVGTRCSDGVVIGADGISTSARGGKALLQVTSEEKIRIIDGKVILVSTGSAGLGQRVEDAVRGAYDCCTFTQRKHACVTTLASTVVNDFRATGVPYLHHHGGFEFGALLAAPMEGCAELVEFDTCGFQPEFKTSQRAFVAMGQGQTLADPFLAFVSRVLWRKREPTVATGIVGVCWALQHALQLAPGGVGEPMRIAVLRKMGDDWKARILDETELQQQRQHIWEIENRISAHSLFEHDADPIPMPVPTGGAA